MKRSPLLVLPVLLKAQLQQTVLLLGTSWKNSKRSVRIRLLPILHKVPSSATAKRIRRLMSAGSMMCDLRCVTYAV